MILKLGPPAHSDVLGKGARGLRVERETESARAQPADRDDPWWSHLGSNQGPYGCEPYALTN